MIAITVSVFGAHQQKSFAEGALLSTAFVLGIAALFTPLGLFAAATGGLFGSALTHPAVLWGLALVFLLLAASMFGLFALDLPPALKNRVATIGGAGVKGAFLLGLVSALIAAPCTGPVVGFLLTWVGQTGNLFIGGLSLLSYALGLGLLFWVVGTFAITLPKSGQWLEWVKSLFGIVMVVAAIYFVRDLIPGLSVLLVREPTVLWSALGATITGVVLGAIHLDGHSPRIGLRVRKAIGVLLTASGLLLLVGYLESPPAGARIKWIDSYEKARQLAQQRRTPLLVDFTASWCGACRELERHTFSDARVVREAQRFVNARIDLSPGKDTPENRAALQRYQQQGLPFVVMHDSSGAVVKRLERFVEADTFVDMLREVR
jgi:thiol:disulfide interchange protein DsbD